MSRKWILALLVAAGVPAVRAQDLVLSEGQYYTDESQTVPYTGRYTEFYDDGMLKMELYLKDGRPEGTYVIYYPDGKIAEVRSYYRGVFHGEWRTYNENGRLTGLASYKNGRKHGPWRTWNDEGILRCELYYTEGKKSGVWRTWDDRGNLLTETSYDPVPPARLPKEPLPGKEEEEPEEGKPDASRKRPRKTGSG